MKVCLLVLWIVLCNCINYPTPLQSYVGLPDSTYSYSVTSSEAVPGATVYILNLTSLSWLTRDDTSPSIWRHWLRVVVPNQLEDSTQSGIIINGGVNSISPPTNNSIECVFLAVRSKIVVSQLSQIPNEPALFFAEGCCNRRFEDAIIAYGWSHFFNDTSKPEWLPRLPMVKAVVRAMDAIQDFLPKLNIRKPEKFYIGGRSKRGWTSWLVPVVDSRVNAIIPMVMPIPNIEGVFNQMWRSLGLWSFALADYLDMDVTVYLNTPMFQKLSDIIDPINYMPYLEKIPKYIVASTGDQFFLPDSPRNFYENLQGPKFLRMLPNTDHSMNPLANAVLDNIVNLVGYIKQGDPIPSLIQKILYSNTTASITVYPSILPDQVHLWVAPTLSSTRRDFRLYICGTNPNCYRPVLWKQTTLQMNPDGSYSAFVDAPTTGFIGFFIEAVFKSPFAQSSWFSVTSEVVVVPDVYPFPSCSLGCSKNGTIPY